MFRKLNGRINLKMKRKKYTKEMCMRACIKIAKRNGSFESVRVINVKKELKSSAQPIYSHFTNFRTLKYQSSELFVRETLQDVLNENNLMNISFLNKDLIKQYSNHQDIQFIVFDNTCKSIFVKNYLLNGLEFDKAKLNDETIKLINFFGELIIQIQKNTKV